MTTEQFQEQINKVTTKAELFKLRRNTGAPKFVQHIKGVIEKLLIQEGYTRLVVGVSQFKNKFPGMGLATDAGHEGEFLVPNGSRMFAPFKCGEVIEYYVHEKLGAGEKMVIFVKYAD